MRPLLICIFLLIFRSSFSQTLEEDLLSILNDQQLIGMSVVVVKDDSVIFSKGFGLADFEREIEITDSTIYRIASISKSVTATALMQLYDGGFFLLNDDISDYLGYTLRNPYFIDVPITFRMLLSHTSSIQDGTGYTNFLDDSYDFDPPPDVSELLTESGDYYTENMFLDHAPGSFFTYSNVNYGLIGTLVEKIANTRFDIYCNENIFEPLGIRGSFNIQDISNLNNVAVLYRKPGVVWVPQADNYEGIMPPPRNLDVYPVGSNAFIFSPQGGLRISANDLSKFMLTHQQNGIFDGVEIISNSTAQIMRETQWEDDGSNGDNYYGLFRKWGLGFHITSNTAGGDIVFPALEMIGHPGEAYGLISDMYFDPISNIGIIFITNGCANNFITGDESAFYTAEEDIFNAVQNFLFPTISISENSLPTFYIYPNPASDFLNFSFHNNTSDIFQLKILSADGKIWVDREINSTVLNISDLAAGVYYAHLSFENDHVETYCFIKVQD